MLKSQEKNKLNTHNLQERLIKKLKSVILLLNVSKNYDSFKNL